MADWLAKNARGTLTVKTDPHTVFVEGVDFALIGRRIEGIFPRYRDVIPAQRLMPGRLVVHRRELLAALKAAHPHTSVGTRRVDLLPSMQGNRLYVHAMREEAKKTDGSSPSAVYDGERLFLTMPLGNARKATPEELDAYGATGVDRSAGGQV